MERRISMITLGVHDLSRARAFYAALGWTGPEVADTVFVQLDGLALCLWDRAQLADECGVTAAGDATGFGGLALAHNVRSAAEVDTIVAVARDAGATVTREPSATFYGGYAGCFRDPEGHVWEIAHNPAFPLTDAGDLVVPDFGDAAP